VPESFIKTEFEESAIEKVNPFTLIRYLHWPHSEDG
jgi:hypothetical protein